MSRAKVVYNACFGGFGLSRAAAEQLAAAGVPEAKAWLADVALQSFGLYLSTTPRHDPRLVAVVERLGKEASDVCSDLRVWTAATDGPVAYNISRYDGKEHVEQVYAEGVALPEETK